MLNDLNVRVSGAYKNDGGGRLHGGADGRQWRGKDVWSTIGAILRGGKRTEIKEDKDRDSRGKGDTNLLHMLLLYCGRTRCDPAVRLHDCLHYELDQWSRSNSNGSVNPRHRYKNSSAIA